MKRLTYLPNLLSSVRIALAPAMLGAAYSNAKLGFTVLLVVTVVTDLVDGAIARKWRAVSEIGRRLDRWGDGLTATLGAVGVFFLWPQAIEREWPWASCAVAGYLLIGLRRWLRPAPAKSFPRWPVKVLGLLLPVSLVPLIQGWASWPFQAAAALHAAVGIWKLVSALGGETSADDAQKVEAKAAQ